MTYHARIEMVIYLKNAADIKEGTQIVPMAAMLTGPEHSRPRPMPIPMP